MFYFFAELPHFKFPSDFELEVWFSISSRVFHGHGKIKYKQIQLHVDENVIPIAQVLGVFTFICKIEKEIVRLEKVDVIEKVVGPTRLDSNLVIHVASKQNDPNDKRLCVDK